MTTNPKLIHANATLGDITKLRDYTEAVTDAGSWVELNVNGYHGIGLLAWRMEGAKRSEEMEEFAYFAVNAINSYGPLVASLCDLLYKCGNGLPHSTEDLLQVLYNAGLSDKEILQNILKG